MSFSNYLELKVLDHVFGGTPYTAPAGRYVALHSADPTDVGNVAELAVANGYARQAATFGTAASGAIANTSTVTFTNTGVDWSTATHFTVWDNVSAGNCLGIGALTASKTIGAGDTGTFQAGTLVINLD